MFEPSEIGEMEHHWFEVQRDQEARVVLELLPKRVFD